MKKNKKGFSLIELLLTLAIIMALSVTAFYLYNKVSDDIQTKKMLTVGHTLYAASNEAANKIGAAYDEENMAAYIKMLNPELFNEDEDKIYYLNAFTPTVNMFNNRTYLTMEFDTQLPVSVCINFHKGMQEMTKLGVSFGDQISMKTIEEIADYCNQEHNGYAIVPLVDFGVEEND